MQVQCALLCGFDSKSKVSEGNEKSRLELVTRFPLASREAATVQCFECLSSVSKDTRPVISQITNFEKVVRTVRTTIFPLINNRIGAEAHPGTNLIRTHVPPAAVSLGGKGRCVTLKRWKSSP